MVVHLPWRRELGGVRPQYELAESLRDAGHQVDHYSLDHAFPLQPRSRLGAHLRPPFRARAIPAVRELAQRYDVIDANQGDLPCAKQALGFEGLLVARSNGLLSAYAEFEHWAERRWPDRRGRLGGRVLRRVKSVLDTRAASRTFRYADLVVVPNPDEMRVLRRDPALRNKTHVVRLGVTDKYLHAVDQHAQECEQRREHNEVVFIGTWDHRKGARDWPDIARSILARVSRARFRFLGTAVSASVVRNELGLSERCDVEVIPTFAAAELPRLLATATVGVLPSYIEAFGLGVLEQLAAGIPSVAYDVPGPRDTLAPFGSAALAPVGDWEALADRVVTVLRLGSTDYCKFANQSRSRAEHLRWSTTVATTLALYEEGLALVRHGRNV